MSRQHILVVNDDPVVTMVAVKVLETHGYRVTTADSGKAALPALEAEPPDLLILDIQMPEIDGIELVASMKERIPFLIQRGPSRRHKPHQKCGRGLEEVPLLQIPANWAVA